MWFTQRLRCIYYPSTDAPQRPNVPSFHMRGPLGNAPNGSRLRFALDSECVPQGDYAWESFAYHQLLEDEELDPEHRDIGHKIGGYCAFTQSDPREPNDPMLSLLQLDDHEVCGWGDSGIAHWFIRGGDLITRNFSNVRFYWDCC